VLFRSPDGLTYDGRMALEEQAIEIIRAQEPALQRTNKGNPGFDLFEVDGNGNTIRWVEVKAMTGTLQNRPVGLSKEQFECAQLNGTSYWLYVVERADSDAEARIVPIRDPAGKARTFTFDKGWLAVAETSGGNE